MERAEVNVQEERPAAEAQSFTDTSLHPWPRQEDPGFVAAPTTLQETGLPPSFLRDLALKIIHYAGTASADHVNHIMGLPASLVDEILSNLKDERLCEAVGSMGLLRGSYNYRLSEKGRARVDEALHLSRYAGTAPVTLDQYIAVTQRVVAKNEPNLSREKIEQALSHLVLSPEMKDAVSRGLYSGRRVMVYGPSGNGKTEILLSFVKHLEGHMVVPQAIYTHGQIIRVFDPLRHKPLSPDPRGKAGNDNHDGEDDIVYTGSELLTSDRKDFGWDKRWVKIQRPAIVVGGELGPESLELAYDPLAGFYQIPAHLKAQGGVFVIDDFGRQKVSPYDLLNRWIVPLESGWDSLTLHSGEIITVPFNVALFFATNLEPAELVDEAFLRRIPYKIPILSPNPDEFKEIMQRLCTKQGVVCTEGMLDYLVHKLYREGPTEPRAAFPRDLLNIVMENARYDGTTPALTHDAIDKACRLYFMGQSASFQKEALRRLCELYNVDYTDEMLDRFFHRLGAEVPIEAAAGMARDLLNVIVENAEDGGRRATLTPEVIDVAARLYFVKLNKPGAARGSPVRGMQPPRTKISR